MTRVRKPAAPAKPVVAAPAQAPGHRHGAGRGRAMSSSRDTACSPRRYRSSLKPLPAARALRWAGTSNPSVARRSACAPKDGIQMAHPGTAISEGEGRDGTAHRCAFRTQDRRQRWWSVRHAGHHRDASFAGVSMIWHDTVRYLRHFHERFIAANPRGTTWFYESWLYVSDKDDPRRWIAFEREASIGVAVHGSACQRIAWRWRDELTGFVRCPPPWRWCIWSSVPRKAPAAGRHHAREQSTHRGWPAQGRRAPHAPGQLLPRASDRRDDLRPFPRGCVETRRHRRRGSHLGSGGGVGVRARAISSAYPDVPGAVPCLHPRRLPHALLGLFARRGVPQAAVRYRRRT